MPSAIMTMAIMMLLLLMLLHQVQPEYYDFEC